MEYVAIALVLGLVGGGVGGYMLATHIHSVASAVTRATTLHTGVPAVDAAAAKVGADAAKALTS